MISRANAWPFALVMSSPFGGDDGTASEWLFKFLIVFAIAGVVLLAIYPRPGARRSPRKHREEHQDSEE